MSQDDQTGDTFVPALKDRVHVPGREEVGGIVDPGKSFGSLLCVGVHFPNTGEVVYYSRKRVRRAG